MVVSKDEGWGGLVVQKLIVSGGTIVEIGKPVIDDSLRTC